MGERIPVSGLLAEETEVHLEDGLEQTHVSALIQSNLVFPQVDNKNLR